MNSSQHNFLIAVCCKFCHFPNHIFFCTASHSSSCKRDDAVGTKLIAAILYFDVCSRMFCCFIQVHLLIFVCMININYSLILTLFFLIKPIQNLNQIFLFIISDNDINTLVNFSACFFCLHIASSCNYNCIRIHLFCTMEHLTGLSVRHVSHCACIDNIHIRAFFKRHNLISIFFQKLLHRFRLICIYFTSQIM